MTLRPARPDDRRFVETVLGNNDLPVADIPETLDCLYVWEREGDPVGVGGLEQYGGVALLRSVVVEESARGTGCGTELCRELLDTARSSGVEAVYLLTTTASGFFEDRGFTRTDRAAVPEAIRQTNEFRDLCPDSAVCMKRDLDATGGDMG